MEEQKQPTEVFFQKKMFLKILQISQQKELCWSLFLAKLQASGKQLY